MGEPAFRAPRVGGEGDLSKPMIARPKLAGIFSRSRRFYSIWKSMMCGEGERLISLGDKSIMFIRLTLVKVDDHFN
jgi:hypothetical protein